MFGGVDEPKGENVEVKPWLLDLASPEELGWWGNWKPIEGGGDTNRFVGGGEAAY